MFQTIGLNTGNVRLDTPILGLCCAIEAVAPMKASAQAIANVGTLRRENVSMKCSLPKSLLSACGLSPVARFIAMSVSASQFGVNERWALVSGMPKA
jgi:hypothetical protein